MSREVRPIPYAAAVGAFAAQAAQTRASLAIWRPVPPGSSAQWPFRSVFPFGIQCAFWRHG